MQVVDFKYSGAANVHVYEEGDDVYDVMLNQTEIAKNNNKFCKLFGAMPVRPMLFDNMNGTKTSCSFSRKTIAKNTLFLPAGEEWESTVRWRRPFVAQWSRPRWFSTRSLLTR